LEELILLCLESNKSELAKFKLYDFLKFHKLSCIEKDCICKETDFLKKNFDLDIEEIYTLVDNLFQ
jgi:hypothetical protein